MSRSRDAVSAEDTAGHLLHLFALPEVHGELARKVDGFRVRIVSSAFVDIPGVEVIKKRWRLEDEIADLQSFDIGIMPLQDSLWTRGKCGYKILQYMGVGIPVVASPVGINTELVRHDETGFLAADAEAWREALLTLAADPALRSAMGRNGRALLEREYSQAIYEARYARILSSLTA